MEVDTPSSDTQVVLPDQTIWRAKRLQAIVKTLSISSSKALLGSETILSLIGQADLYTRAVTRQLGGESDSGFEQELQWLLLGKAAVQSYGVVLNTLLEQTRPLSDEIWYWDDVLESYQSTVLYSIQTSPLRFWDWCRCIFKDTRRRIQRGREGSTRAWSAEPGTSPERSESSFSQQWKHFYSLVRESVRARSISRIERTVLSPFALSRAQARDKQNGLKKLREMSASGLGVLMDECLHFSVDEEGSIITKGQKEANVTVEAAKEEWKSILEKSVTLMETVVKTVTSMDLAVSDFEEAVFASVDDESAIVEQSAMLEERNISSQALLAKRLQDLLKIHVPDQESKFRKLAKEHGRPSIFIRYWLPATILVMSSGTILRITLNRRAALTTWILEAGNTIVDFWSNWVVDPVKKVIGTIRHDENSEVALMSKGSLEGDRASLERMVVDFAVDNSSEGRSLTEAEVAAVRDKVRQGDLTPVLRAYERDLRKPIVGTVKGDLIRALLIQVQKTKVDIEVAVSGIDSLLKSQQLVFG